MLLHSLLLIKVPPKKGDVLRDSTLDKELRVAGDCLRREKWPFPRGKSPNLLPSTNWSSATKIMYIEITLYGLGRLNLGVSVCATTHVTTTTEKQGMGLRDRKKVYGRGWWKERKR